MSEEKPKEALNRNLALSESRKKASEIASRLAGINVPGAGRIATEKYIASAKTVKQPKITNKKFAPRKPTLEAVVRDLSGEPDFGLTDKKPSAKRIKHYRYSGPEGLLEQSSIFSYMTAPQMRAVAKAVHDKWSSKRETMFTISDICDAVLASKLLRTAQSVERVVAWYRRDLLRLMLLTEVGKNESNNSGEAAVVEGEE